MEISQSQFVQKKGVYLWLHWKFEQNQPDLTNTSNSVVTKKFWSFFRCGPCRDFAGTFEGLSAKYDNAVFIKVDVEECEGVGAKFQVINLLSNYSVPNEDTPAPFIQKLNTDIVPGHLTAYFRNFERQEEAWLHDWR